MKYRYTKYTGDLLDEIDLEDLVSRISDMLLSSGFSDPWGDPSDDDEDRSKCKLMNPKFRYSSESFEIDFNFPTHNLVDTFLKILYAMEQLK